MREADYAAARAAVLAGEDPPPALLEDCRRNVGLLIHSSGLPAHYSPDGVWSPEAIEEVYADWVAVRLVGRGQLRAMLQRAPVLRVFGRMAETSVRQHLIDGLKPSQAANLYERVTRLPAGDRFVASGSGTGRLWRLADGPAAPFDGDDRRLLGVSHGTAVVADSPLHSGLLSGRFSADRSPSLHPTDWRRNDADFRTPALERNLALADVLRSVAATRGLTVSEVAVAWVLQVGATAAAVGARSPRQVHDWVAAGSLRRRDADLDEIHASLAQTGAGRGPVPAPGPPLTDQETEKGDAGAQRQDRRPPGPVRLRDRVLQWRRDPGAGVPPRHRRLGHRG